MKVAITGRAGSGKSTLARHLERLAGFKRISLADEVRAIAKALGYDVRKPYSRHVREILQVIGMTGRMLDEDVWVRKLLEKTKDYDRVVVDDVRFLNEARIFREHGFLIVKIETPESVLVERLGSGYVPKSHVSEREIEKIEADLVLRGTDPVDLNAALVLSHLDKSCEDLVKRS